MTSGRSYDDHKRGFIGYEGRRTKDGFNGIPGGGETDAKGMWTGRWNGMLDGWIIRQEGRYSDNGQGDIGYRGREY